MLYGRKVIIMLGCLEVGGAEQQALLLARWLKDECGANVEIWGISHGGRLTARCDETGIPWQVIGNPLADGLITTVRRLLGVAWRLRLAKVDVILPYTLVPNVIAGIIWRLTGAKICIWNQRDEGTEGHREPYERWAVRLTPLFLANSTTGADYLIRNLQVDKKKVSVVHNGIALEQPAESRSVWRQRLGLADSAVCVAMISNLSDKKDHATLINAWRVVVDTLSPIPGQLKLVLAGRHDGAAKGLIDQVTVLNLAEHVSFLGPVRDVAGLLQAVDVGTYSSVTEGLPNGVLECMATGKAMVATNIPGIREALGDGYTLLSRPGDPAEMAAHLITLINNPGIRQSIGRQNRERAVACFDTRSMCQKMTSILVGHLAHGQAAQ